MLAIRMRQFFFVVVVVVLLTLASYLTIELFIILSGMEKTQPAHLVNSFPEPYFKFHNLRQGTFSFAIIQLLWKSIYSLKIFAKHHTRFRKVTRSNTGFFYAMSS